MIVVATGPAMKLAASMTRTPASRKSLMIVAGIALAPGVPSPVAIAPDEIDRRRENDVVVGGRGFGRPEPRSRHGWAGANRKEAPKPSDEIANDGSRHGGDSVARHR